MFSPLVLDSYSFECCKIIVVFLDISFFLVLYPLDRCTFQILPLGIALNDFVDTQCPVTWGVYLMIGTR